MVKKTRKKTKKVAKKQVAKKVDLYASQPKEVEVPNLHMGQPPIVDIPVTGDLKRGEVQEIETFRPGIDFADKAAQLAFNEEVMEIVISESTDPNADNPVMLGVNGKVQWVVRGQRTHIRRKYVARLATARPVGFTQAMHTDPATGFVSQQMVPHAALRYPFVVTNDPNPGGREWLENLMASAA